MGATYTRQSTYSDGDIITAAHTNDEFNQLLAAFASGTGHTHDGTTAEGGPITKLLGNTLTFGAGTAGTDITITFDGEDNDGVLKWMEDEDYFEFSDDILVASTEKLQFGDTATLLQQSSDGVLRIDGEATIDLNASTAVTVSNDLKLDSDSAVLGFGADNDVTLTHVADTALLLNDAIKLTFRDSALSVSSSTDGQLDIDADTEVEITTPLLEISADATVGDDLTLKSDAAVLGFGADTDTTLTHVADTGLLLNSTRQLQFGDSGTYIHQSADGVLDLVSDTEIEINATTIDINGNADISGTLGVTGAATFAGNVTVDGNLDVTGTFDLSDSNFTNAGDIQLDSITGDGDTNTSIAFSGSDVITVTAGGDAQITFTNGGIIPSVDNDIDLGSSSKEFKDAFFDGTVTTDAIVVAGTIGHDDDTDLLTLADGIVTVAGEISVTTLDIGGTNVTSTAAELNILDGVTSTATELNIMDGDTSATSTTLADADRVVVNDAGTMKQVALTDFETYFESALDTLSNVTTVGALNSGSITSGFGAIDNGSSAITTTGTITGGVVTADDVSIDGKVITMTGSSGDTAVLTAGTNGTLDITTTDAGGASANIQITADGTAELAGTTVTLDSSGGITLDADGGTITFADGGSSLGTITSSGYSGNAATATVATTVTISDNESTDEDNAIIFTSGGDVDGGNIGLESDGDLTYNPSTGRLTATQLSGTLQTAAQGNVTSLGTLTTLTVDNVIINGSTIGHTGDTDLMTVASGVLTVAGEVDATSLDISGDADIDGTLEADAITVNGTALNTVIGNEATALAIALG